MPFPWPPSHLAPCPKTAMDDAAKAAKRAEIEAKVAAMKAEMQKKEVRFHRLGFPSRARAILQPGIVFFHAADPSL